MQDQTEIRTQDHVNWQQEIEFTPLRMQEEAKPVRPSSTALVLRLLEPETPPAVDLWLASRLRIWTVVVLSLAAATVLGGLVVDRFVITKVVLPSPSPAPQDAPAQAHYLNRWRYLWLPPERGDRVVVEQANALTVKQIVARPSDSLQLKDGAIYVNGTKLETLHPSRDESSASANSTDKLLQLGRDQYYVLGDEPADSDGPAHGVVHRKNILGLLIR